MAPSASIPMYFKSCELDFRNLDVAAAPAANNFVFGYTLAMVRTHSYTIALPILEPTSPRRRASAKTAYMFSEAALSDAPSVAKILRILI